MKHTVTLTGYEIPDHLRNELNSNSPALKGIPIEDRQLVVEVETAETDPQKVKGMLLRAIGK